MLAIPHRPVLLREALEALAVRPDGIYLDATFGRGGHARAILSHLGPEGRLLLNDRDPEAVAMARAEFGSDPRVAIRHGDFASIAEWPVLAGGLDGVLFDLGVSSPQLEDPRRGFSFQHDGPLDMRMDPSAGESAADFLARASEAEIARVLRDYGEEPRARRIARAIVAHRRREPLTRTRQLADLIARAAGPRGEAGRHPATRSFQALRIQVNGELVAIERALAQIIPLIRPGGRLVTIAFHSLEDRLCKRAIAGRGGPAGVVPGRRLPPQPLAPPLLRPVGRARRPGAEELAGNPRARSAVMRVAERVR
jgi:16S rRNA (cytosine1402-N4)-methyltransferase